MEITRVIIKQRLLAGNDSKTGDSHRQQEALRSKSEGSRVLGHRKSSLHEAIQGGSRGSVDAHTLAYSNYHYNVGYVRLTQVWASATIRFPKTIAGGR